MTDQKFKTEVFDKMNDVYKLLKMIKDCGPHDNEDVWEAWINESTNYINSIKDSEVQGPVARFLLDMGDCIAHLNKGEL